MRVRGFKIYISIVCTLLLAIVSGCIHEIVNEPVGTSFISVKGAELRAATHPGDEADRIINTLRIISFDHTTKDQTTNVRYNAWLGDIIQHAILPGTYDFVFLANEPSLTNIVVALNDIDEYSDLDDIGYPASAFNSDDVIPMIQEIKEVTILPNGKGARLSNGTEVTLLELGLERLAARIDVVLESKENLTTALSGVTFSNIPDRVPLTSRYTGTIVRNVIRKFTVNENSSYFSDGTPEIAGMTWAKQVNRIILPSNELGDIDDKTKAVRFTVNMIDSYSPSCELKVNQDPVDYSLPINTKLDLTGIIKEPLEMNVQASNWSEYEENWNISGNRILNVSHTEVNITDFNGARISFWSNMPIVRVLDKTWIKSTNSTMDTNDAFNALSTQSWSQNWDERFSYDPATGSGYMDILLDRPNSIGTETYKITLLAAEDFAGTNGLEKTITINVKQEGTRYVFERNSASNLYATPYVGAFYKNNEMGERIISGFRNTYWRYWNARVPDEFQSFITISSTPSLDPNIGTNNPGEAEDYPVIPNKYKGENGTSVSGKGRVYFRIGLLGQNPETTPRYGYVIVRYQLGEDYNDYVEAKVYVRQGETADYLMRSGTSGSSFGQKFSPYNLTVKAFKDNSETTAEWSAITSTNMADFVDYPTQAGAHFQWGLPIASKAKGLRAYFPTNKNVTLSNWGLSGWPTESIGAVPLWDPASGDKFKDTYEICPSGYYRPKDGLITQIAVNKAAAQIYESEWRMSLFQSPMTGDGATAAGTPMDPSNVSGKYNAKVLNEVMYGFYADGFFDRRPIQSREMIDGVTRGSSQTTDYIGVSLDNAEAAYSGTLFVNSSDASSLFFPSAGRRWYQDGSLEYAGQTGYYWSSSVAPGWTDTSSGVEVGTPYGNIWSMEFNYPSTQPISAIHKFGYSIRCVKR